MPPTTQPGIRTAAQIRREFIEFFTRRHGHAFVPGSPVVPHNDPTLLFTNAGMNQFKDVFLGQGTRDYTRAVNSQKCIRAGGKHNDLEDVGKDHYHHTFFEMLGNWSFGDYFKAEAIEWAWQLLTAAPPEGWGIDPQRLHVTVFAGDASDGLDPDLEAETLWTRFVDPSRISRWGKKDNFWEMGDTGPCGPCSEIHYDFGGNPGSAGALVNRGHPQVVELWNLVFIQFNRGPGGVLSPLPARHVDTGMGLERLARVLQHKDSNYDLDLFTPIFETIRRHTTAHPYQGALEDPVDIAYRVLGDHIRCLTNAITDGAWPGPDGRGFVLRRILRRGVRHAHQTLGVDGPLLCDLVPAVVESLGDAFPELKANPDKVASVIRDEEESFLRTLDRGIALFDEAASRATSGRVSADDAFKLHDTYGFPIDLTRVMAEERGMSVDEDGYAALMDEARQRSRQAGGGDEGLTLPPDALARLRHMGVKPTLDGYKYEARPLDTEVLAIWNGTDFDETARVGRHVAVITHRTNHYAEAGGQVGDTGRMEAETPGGASTDTEGRGAFHVDHTMSVGGFVLHAGHVTEGTLRVRDRVTLAVNRRHRETTRSNHTATHLLNFALRRVVGPEEDQRGSLVAPDRLRFDFACSHAMTTEQLAETEQLVNQRIDADLAVDAEVIPLEQARGIAGVRAIFGEKYPDPVRVVAIGARLADVLASPGDERWADYSIELCGGTHLHATGEASRLVILHEQALASGVRRITAVTGAAALAAEQAADELVQRAAAAVSLAGEPQAAEVADITEQLDRLTIGTVDRARIERLLEPAREAVRAHDKARRKADRAGVVEQAQRIAAEADGPAIVTALDTTDREGLLAAMDAIRSRHPESAVMLLGADAGEGKVVIVARVPETLIKAGLKAGDWVREAAKACGGSGGGKPDMAQAGGKRPDQVPAAIEAARTLALETLR